MHSLKTSNCSGSYFIITYTLVSVKISISVSISVTIHFVNLLTKFDINCICAHAIFTQPAKRTCQGCFNQVKQNCLSYYNAIKSDGIYNYIP